MITNTMKYSFLFLLLLIVGSPNFAQVKTKVRLMGGEQYQKTIELAISDIINAANLAYKSGTPTFNNPSISRAAIENILKIWKVTRFYCAEDKLKLLVLESADGKKNEIRNIPLFFLEGDKVVKQSCLVTISKQGVIEDFLIGLESDNYDALVNKGVDVTDQRRRQIILGFVEEYRTAYNKRDIDFIEKVFSDQAVIIKGVVYMKNLESEEILKTVPKDKIKFTKMTKDEYIADLKSAFKLVNYLKIDFEKIEMARHSKEKNIYGITLFQKWKQDTYSDVGYLFLMIDFNDEENPKIHVRAWQPEEFLTPTNKFDLTDFEPY